jgi:hypothetical protein
MKEQNPVAVFLEKAVKQPEGEKITISQLEYDRLIKDSLMLQALRIAGVDNWEGYHDALDTFLKW